MNAAADISTPLMIEWGSPSEAPGRSLLVRVWMWLSQIWGRGGCEAAAETVFHLGLHDRLNGHAFQNIISAKDLNRQRRRLLARYTRLRLSAEQVKKWVRARRKAHRFDGPLARYYGLAFMRRMAFARALCFLPVLALCCHAPLSPD